MSTKARVPLARQSDGKHSVVIDTTATRGATVGVDLMYNGKVVTAEMLFGQGNQEALSYTYWRMVREVPVNVQALAETDTTGLYVITGPGTSATRQLEAGDLLGIENPGGIAGNPRVVRTTLQHTELSPSDHWIVNHNLGRKVNVEVYTTGGARVLAEIILVSDNQASIHFASPMAGYAIIE